MGAGVRRDRKLTGTPKTGSTKGKKSGTTTPGVGGSNCWCLFCGDKKSKVAKGLNLGNTLKSICCHLNVPPFVPTAATSAFCAKCLPLITEYSNMHKKLANLDVQLKIMAVEHFGRVVANTGVNSGESKMSDGWKKFKKVVIENISNGKLAIPTVNLHRVRDVSNVIVTRSRSRVNSGQSGRDTNDENGQEVASNPRFRLRNAQKTTIKAKEKVATKTKGKASKVNLRVKKSPEPAKSSTTIKIDSDEDKRATTRTRPTRAAAALAKLKLNEKEKENLPKPKSKRSAPPRRRAAVAASASFVDVVDKNESSSESEEWSSLFAPATPATPSSAKKMKACPKSKKINLTPIKKTVAKRINGTKMKVLLEDDKESETESSVQSGSLMLPTTQPALQVQVSLRRMDEGQQHGRGTKRKMEDDVNLKKQENLLKARRLNEPLRLRPGALVATPPRPVLPRGHENSTSSNSSGVKKEPSYSSSGATERKALLASEDSDDPEANLPPDERPPKARPRSPETTSESGEGDDLDDDDYDSDDDEDDPAPNTTRRERDNRIWAWVQNSFQPDNPEEAYWEFQDEGIQVPSYHHNEEEEHAFHEKNAEIQSRQDYGYVIRPESYQ